MRIGERIKELRLLRGYSQTELAHLAMLKPPSVSQYESGVRTPSISVVGRLNKVLGTSLDYLVYGNGELTTVEMSILALFDTLSVTDREHVLQYLKFLVFESK